MSDVTVIVPVYNGENYLRTCFDSLLHQKQELFDVLVVNDGSEDASQDIIDAYIKKYPGQFRTIYKENGGYGSDIRTGVRACETEYFMILDADDLLLDNAVEKMLDTARVSGADVVIGARMNQPGLDGQLIYDCCYDTKMVKLHTNMVYNHSSAEYSDLFAVDPRSQSKLYRRNITEAFRYPSKVGYADHILFYLSLIRAEKVIYTEEPLSVYRMRHLDMPEDQADQISGRIRAYKRLLTQAEHSSNVPAAFYGRMYLAFDEMLEETASADIPAETKKELIHALNDYEKRLVPHGRAVRSALKNTNMRASDRIAMEGLLNSTLRSAVFAMLTRSLNDKEKE